MEAVNRAIYDRQFRGNILVVGKTGWGKTYFLQKLAPNKFFGELVKAEWVSGIKIDDQREAEIQACFSNKVEFHHAADPDELTELIEKFKLRTRDFVKNESNSGFGENISRDRLIVMDDVSGIADGSHKFAEFLTVSRKNRYHCICFSYYWARQSSMEKKFLSQTNIFNIFPSSVPYNKVAKILQSNCRQTTKKYAPVHLMWLSRFFVDLANTKEWDCLTIDCRGRNKNGPGRYQTQASNPEKQVSYFNQLHDDELYNAFISKRIKARNFRNSIYFKINRVQGKDKTFGAEKTLKEDGAYDRFTKLDTVSKQPESYGGSRKGGHE